jgi:hypothetical protein
VGANVTHDCLPVSEYFIQALARNNPVFPYSTQGTDNRAPAFQNLPFYDQMGAKTLISTSAQVGQS